VTGQLEPNASDWVIELWWRPRQRTAVEKPIYWHGPSDPNRASGLHGSVAVFSNESEARETFGTHGGSLPEDMSRWDAVSLRTAQSRNPPTLAIVTWSRARLAPRTN
jgi:hypothetical protein